MVQPSLPQTALNGYPRLAAVAYSARVGVAWSLPPLELLSTLSIKLNATKW